MLIEPSLPNEVQNIMNARLYNQSKGLVLNEGWMDIVSMLTQIAICNAHFRFRPVKEKHVTTEQRQSLLFQKTVHYQFQV